MKLHTLVARPERAGDQILRPAPGLSYRRFMALVMVGELGVSTQRALADPDGERTLGELGGPSEPWSLANQKQGYPRLMRYLTRSFAVGALRRGKGIEQFLGPVDVAGEPAIRWVSVDPRGGQYRVAVHLGRDPDDESVRDLANLLPLDPAEEQYVGEGRELALVPDPETAITQAETLADAVPGQWVNCGVAGEGYADLVRSRRGVT
ncbi:hypothetical protein GCM10022225_52120 [Plantactinospora mayteni]|uniref:Uncharacterized protein n=1 Tax=Plantactinospora mayteni TaxID=566021 RepID=A0ABQ4EYY3_9ACTN|nr:hypothetical protein [Plantactinospora mayteni]GIG99871.1 hypothetical protein Pma05_64440 [Plantactinospora mayteni]